MGWRSRGEASIVWYGKSLSKGYAKNLERKCMCYRGGGAGNKMVQRRSRDEKKTHKKNESLGLRMGEA